MPSAEQQQRSDSPDDREKDDSARGGKGKPSSASKTKDLSHVPCKFYKVGSCTAGSSCPFSHSLAEPGGQKDVCAWFVKGNCKFGHKCALAHILPGQTMAMDRKNKKAAQIAAGGSNNKNGDSGGKGGRGGNKRDNGNNRLLAGGSTAPTRARPPMNMPLKATISPSAPAPPLKDTDFASFGALDESTQLPIAPARKKSPPPEPPKPSTSPTLPVSAPRRPSMSTPTKDFGPIGSPPSAATSPSSRMHSGTPPTQANGFLSTSPFSAPGSKPPFLGYGDAARQGMAASLGANMTMGGGLAGWNNNPSANGVSSSPLRGGLLSAGRVNGQRPINGADYDISVEYEEHGIKARRKATVDDPNEDLEDFLPSSLTDLLTPEERSRRMSRTNSAQSPSLGGGFDNISASPHRHGLGVPLNQQNAGAVGHRYSRSVPAPSFLGSGAANDHIKSIWTDGPPPGLPSSPLGAGMPSSYSSNSGAGGGLSSSFAERLPSLSPSNASAAFLPSIHHYIAQKQGAGMRTTSNPSVTTTASSTGLFASNTAAHPGPPGIAHYLQSGPGPHNASSSSNANLNNTTTSPPGMGPGASPSPYVRPNPFDLTQQQQHNPAYAAHVQGGGGNGNGNFNGGGQGGVPNLNDTHILSPNARALQAHAPGQSLPQGLAAGYSRIHALPPPMVGSPSPAASPGVYGGFGNINTGVGSPGQGGGMRDWATMSTGSISGSPGVFELYEGRRRRRRIMRRLPVQRHLRDLKLLRQMRRL
ncbi:hypothetical protein R3P38DRAFT_3433469 [Favolaschia claudopus]|uniref:C3H1-type domain-containing protein n=1 Tax=Favolaschia claudopus TaxID=2862362 RepID=A0AAW0D1Z5_9AGAR